MDQQVPIHLMECSRTSVVEDSDQGCPVNRKGRYKYNKRYKYNEPFTFASPTKIAGDNSESDGNLEGVQREENKESLGCRTTSPSSVIVSGLTEKDNSGEPLATAAPSKSKHPLDGDNSIAEHWWQLEVR
ncbi:hypothetical protein SERLA73DRAFT_80983 [Serpula lacrymans var. lacrymans S7.3]|uniref:Uncharacterized protein n=1 Tax=Serpula lacrymans var. lacrymans (strain S7.3) TaxID=936435 RepID=F8QKK2_SERL3|nr:hypothetical protein SERLA73DRAFT_80983 [Serpula lacrymans var. lacrymans S7.3]